MMVKTGSMTFRVRTAATGAAVLLPLAFAGCASRPDAEDGGYETVRPDPRRDGDVAERHNAEAVRRMARGDYDGAERELKAALAADVMYGPAHNNLGKAYYHQGKLYLAAWEFQYAAKLMPGVPEPKNNLGLVFESAGKLDDAVAHYGEATRLAPDDVQFLGNLARARVRRGDQGLELRELLEQLVLRETRPDWADWARRQLSGMSTSPATE
jgi:Tfp pilus assembly protein PilF